MALTKKLQEIVDQITGERIALLEATKGLSEPQADWRPPGSDWSISDILHHLALTEDANMKLCFMMLKQAQEQSIPPDPSPEASVLDALDGFAGTIQTKVKAPERVAPRSQVRAEESLARLSASRERLLEAVDQLARYDLSQLVWPHPFLGRINLYQWLLMAGRHESRHTDQIARIKGDAAFPKRGS
jgi:hypothetical protein